MLTERSSLEIYHLKQRIKEIEEKTSATMSTSLVSIYIPPGTQLSDISNLLKDEVGKTTNIKDKNTGKAVADALRSILARMQYLRNGKNGLALFAGITQQSQKVEYYAIEPPEPVAIKTYVCDTRFHVDHLKAMLNVKEQLGIIVIDRGGCTFALIRGSHLRILSDEPSFVMGKHSKGGQSAQRIARGIEIMAREYYSKMAVKANNYFQEENDITALVIGGPAMSKDEFIEHPMLDYRLKEKILKVYDVGYTGEPGIRELLSRAEDDLFEFSLVGERKLLKRFLTELGEDSGKAIYGASHVKKALKMSAVDVVLFSEAIETIHVRIKCSNCGKEFLETSIPENIPELETKLMQHSCPQCKAESLSIAGKEYLIDEFEKLAQETGASIEIISMGHEDGIILKNTFTGIAAVLRFPVDF